MPRLILARNEGESLLIGEGPTAVRVVVHSIVGRRAKLVIDAPAGVAVDRSEIRDRKNADRRAAS